MKIQIQEQIALAMHTKIFIKITTALLYAVIGVTLIACGTSEPATNQPESPTATVTQPNNDALVDETNSESSNKLSEPEQNWTVVTESENLDIILATPDLATGKRRFAVVITDDSGIVALPVVQLASYKYTQDTETRQGPIETQRARFYPFPYGSRGLHAAEMNFNSPGRWGVEARVPRPDGDIEYVEVVMDIHEKTMSVDIGQTPPRTHSRTLEDVEDIADLTTGSMRNPDLYQISVPEAIDSGKPTVIVFASPAFCTNAVCGPQVEVLSNLSEKYPQRANFIHVDLYENPQEIQGDLSRGIPSPLLQEWGLISQEWTFIMDDTGVVTGRFENFAPEPELERSLTQVLNLNQN